MSFQEKLTVLHSDNGIFAEYTNEAYEYDRDTFVIAINASEDYLYLGRYKPFNAVYVEISVANSQTAATFTIEYGAAAGYGAVDLITDDTKAFQRSGFIKWIKPTAWEETTVNSTQQYWIRIRPSVTLSGTTALKGINLVFADDVDLKEEFHEVANYLPSGATSFILTHQAVKKDIIQKIRRDGKAVVSSSTGALKDITEWELHDFEQVRNAAKHLALSKIYMNISDNPGDIYMMKADRHLKMYNESIDMFFISLDTDDSGFESNAEKEHSWTAKLVRR